VLLHPKFCMILERMDFLDSGEAPSRIHSLIAEQSSLVAANAANVIFRLFSEAVTASTLEGRGRQRPKANTKEARRRLFLF
jgi:hypothetical protein